MENSFAIYLHKCLLKLEYVGVLHRDLLWQYEIQQVALNLTLRLRLGLSTWVLQRDGLVYSDGVWPWVVVVVLIRLNTTMAIQGINV